MRRDDRKHQPASRSGEEIETSILHGARDRRPGLHIADEHLSRLRADVWPRRRRRLSVRPLAEAVVFALIASYILSCTLVPTLANLNLLRGHTA